MAKIEPVDSGTPELSRRHSLRPEKIPNSHQIRVRVLDADYMDRLLMIEEISLDEYDNLARMHLLLVRGELHGLRASDFEPRISSGTNQSVSHDAAEARADVNSIMKYIQTTESHLAASLVYAVAYGDHIKKSDLRFLHKGIEALGAFFNE